MLRTKPFKKRNTVTPVECPACTSKRIVEISGQQTRTKTWWCNHCGHKWELAAQKFGAQKVTINGQKFDSTLEGDYGTHLDMLVQAKQIRGYKRQVTVPIEIKGRSGRIHRICGMRVDFLVIHNGVLAPDGSEEWIEVKGFETPEWQIKAKLFNALYEDRKYTVIYKKPKNLLDFHMTIGPIQGRYSLCDTVMTQEAHCA